MAYPIKLFEYETEEGRTEANSFLQSVDQMLTELFPNNKKNDTMRLYHRWETSELPDYLKDIGTNSIQKIIKQLPEGEMKWKGSVGLYGRKTGSVIKREDNLLYRIIINLGDMEIYYLDGDGFTNEPAVLPNCYALLCSPVMIDKVDIKVRRDAIRKNLNPKLASMVPKIRARNYMRSTIVLDLLMEGLTFPDLNTASVPVEEVKGIEENPIDELENETKSDNM